MMEECDGWERTLSHLERLLAEAGWKLIGMHEGSPFTFTQKAIAVPV
jgi:hypothetical protein